MNKRKQRRQQREQQHTTLIHVRKLGTRWYAIPIDNNGRQKMTLADLISREMYDSARADAQYLSMSTGWKLSRDTEMGLLTDAVLLGGTS
jgi:hypothetical protein